MNGPVRLSLCYYLDNTDDNNNNSNTSMNCVCLDLYSYSTIKIDGVDFFKFRAYDMFYYANYRLDIRLLFPHTANMAALFKILVKLIVFLW